MGRASPPARPERPRPRPGCPSRGRGRCSSPAGDRDGQAATGRRRSLACATSSPAGDQDARRTSCAPPRTSRLHPSHSRLDHHPSSPPLRRRRLGQDTGPPPGVESVIPRARSVGDRGVPVPVDTARAGTRHGPQPHRVLGPPHELRPRRPPDRTARRVLRRPGRRRHGADHHGGALDPPHRLAVREADPRLPPRRDPRLPADHRRRAPPPGADLRPAQPQRRPGVVDVHPPARLGALAGGRSTVPGGAQGGHDGGDRRDRRRLRARRRALRRRWLRRHRAAVQPLVDRARLPLPRHQPPHRRLRRQPGQPGAAAHARSSPPCGR